MTFHERLLKMFSAENKTLAWRLEEQPGGLRMQLKMYVWCSGAFADPSRPDRPLVPDWQEVTEDNIGELDRALSEVCFVASARKAVTSHDLIRSGVVLFVAQQRKQLPWTRLHLIPATLFADLGIGPN